jgi:hypothetical protein
LGVGEATHLIVGEGDVIFELLGETGYCADPVALSVDARPATRWAATPSSGELVSLSLAGAVIFFGGWQLIAMSGLVSQYVLPSPIAVLEQIYRLEAEPFAGFLLYQHLLSSLERFLLGFLLAAALGIPLGLIMGRYRLMDEIVTPLFEAYRYVAPLAGYRSPRSGSAPASAGR